MTHKQQQQLNRNRRNALAEIATQTGVIHRVNKLLSVNYILHSQSAVFLAEIEEILNDAGLRGGKLISLAKRLNNAFDDYFKEFSKMVPKEQVQNWADDLSAFDGIFRKFSSPTDEFEPDYSEVDIEGINKKYNVKITRKIPITKA